MGSFPPEILHNVFIQFDLSERLLCTLVCRTWWSVLDSYSLLYNVEIKEKEQFNRFMDMIKQSPLRAAQVEDLSIGCCFEDEFNKRDFSDIFPNLRRINLDCNLLHFHNTTFSQPIKTTQTTSKIQHISDSLNCSYAFHMMTLNLCGQLRTLTLGSKRGNISCYRILPQMKNLPVLQKLTLIGPCLGAADLELLHNNIPSIQHLELKEMTVEDSEMPPNIRPPTLLCTINFDIRSTIGIHSHANWYRYLSQKYTNVTTWDYCDNVLSKMAVNLESLCNNGFSQFLELVGSTQSPLEIPLLPENINIFELLDGRNCQIKEFSLSNCQGNSALQYLANSNQSKYVQTLLIDDTEIGSFLHFKKFMALTKVKLEEVTCDDSNIFNLTDCLNSFPDTLKEFSLECDHLKVDPANCKTSSIERLDISTTEYTRELNDTVFSCFPKLVDLKLYGDVKCDLNVTLQNPYLKLICFCTSLITHGFSFKCPPQTEPQYYVLGFGVPTGVESKDMKRLPVLSVVSSTKRSLEISSKKITIVS